MIEDELNEIGGKFIELLKQQFDDKGLNDTGAAKESVTYKVEGRKLIIEGVARIIFLVFGRGAGTPPPFQIIKEWVERKLNPEPAAVWIITKTIVDKIAAEGTNIFKDRAKGLEFEIILDEVNKQLFNEIAIFEQARITNGIIKQWQ